MGGNCSKLTGEHVEYGKAIGWCFYNRIIDANAPSFVRANLFWEAIANKAAEAKKRKYKLATEKLRGSFTSLVCSTDAALHQEYIAYQKRLACRLASKWEKPFSTMMSWVRVKTQFAIIRSVDLHLRGAARHRITGQQIQDGAGIGIGH